MLLSEPLNGGFQEGIMIVRMDSKHDLKLVERGESTLKGSALPSPKRLRAGRHRVSPKTTPIRPPAVSHPLLKGYEAPIVPVDFSLRLL